MTERLAHRGPDGSGLWLSSNFPFIGLGHRRLAILDLSNNGSQPMEDNAENRIAYNGEIYNYIELKEHLRALGYSFNTDTDTEVVLASYREWGTSCIEKFNGMFSFAVWDPTRQRLFVARDRFGEKPLFYTYVEGHRFVFGSEVKALLAHPDVKLAPRLEELDAFAEGISRDNYNGCETLFQGIYQILPGEAMVVDRELRISNQWRYWRPDRTRCLSPFKEEEAADQLVSLLRKSIDLRLRSDVAVGSSLSGGLDSSAIVSIISSLQGDNACSTFSARFDEVDPVISEGPQIDLVVRACQANPYSTTPDPFNLARSFRKIHWHQEFPFPSASIFNQWCVMELASKTNIKVLLDGQGADELFAGYTNLFNSRQRDLLRGVHLFEFLANRLLLRVRAFRFSSAYKNRTDAMRRIHVPELRASGALRILLRSVVQAAKKREFPSSSDEFNSGLARGWSGFADMLRYADRNSMAFGREIRLPFLDNDLVEFAMSLPAESLIKWGWSKRILRESLRDVVPEKTRLRVDKMGYVAPFEAWLRGPLKNWAEAKTLSVGKSVVSCLSKQRVENTWHAHLSGQKWASKAIFRWISLHEWLTMLEDGIWEGGYHDNLPADSLESR